MYPAWLGLAWLGLALAWLCLAWLGMFLDLFICIVPTQKLQKRL
jgi:hypothetical protein